MEGSNIHVVYNENKWLIEGEGASEAALKEFGTKREAIEAGKTIAKEKQVELIVHHEDGTIGERERFGREPENVPD